MKFFISEVLEMVEWLMLLSTASTAVRIDTSLLQGSDELLNCGSLFQLDICSVFGIKESITLTRTNGEPGAKRCSTINNDHIRTHTVVLVQ